MKPLGECAAEALRRLAAMPFLDRLDLAAVSGWSRGAVYAALAELERGGLVESLSHASELTAPARRFCLTADGLSTLARSEGMAVDELLAKCPVSVHGRRIILERLDAAAAVYRLAAAVSTVAHPVRFRWYRALPMDAAIEIPDGCTLAVVRQGRTADRTAFAKRLWRLRQAFRPSAVLLLAPDEVRLRHSRRLIAGAPFPAFLALERDAARSGPEAAIWRTPSGAALLDLHAVLAHTGPPSPWPVEEPLSRAFLPGPLGGEAGGDWMLQSMLKPVEKRAVDILFDWPWITPAHLGALLGVRHSRLFRVMASLLDLGLADNARIDGLRRLALSDRGLALLARRDRTAIGAARQRWSISPSEPTVSSSWRRVSGGRSRQLLRNIDHTDAVHWFAAVLARQARSHSVEVLQLDPARLASRHFRHGGGLRAVNPDAFGILRRGRTVLPFFLEWERRAVRPVTMAGRIAPYLRYYASQRPTDDHGAQPLVLVVFEEELTAAHFLRVAREEMESTRVNVPLRVSHRSILEQAGPLGRAWRSVDGAAFTEPLWRS